MSMTSLGKGLVLANLILSVGVAVWGLTVYASGTDWSDNRGKDLARDGELLARSETVKKWNEAHIPAARSWNTTRVELARLDERRASDRAWYEKELAFDRNGATKEKPAHVLKLVNAQPETGADGRPKMDAGRDQFGQPLESLVAYNLTRESLHRQIDVETKNLAKSIEEDTELTNRLGGDASGSKGLQHRILDERGKLAEAINEQRFVRPLLINAVVESDLIFKRQRALEARIKELEKIGVAGK
jgi:hypothetical protein